MLLSTWAFRYLAFRYLLSIVSLYYDCIFNYVIVSLCLSDLIENLHCRYFNKIILTKWICLWTKNSLLDGHFSQVVCQSNGNQSTDHWFKPPDLSFHMILTLQRTSQRVNPQKLILWLILRFRNHHRKVFSKNSFSKKLFCIIPIILSTFWSFAKR